MLRLWLNVYLTMQSKTNSSVETGETALISHNHNPVVECTSVEDEVEFQIPIK